MTIHNYSFDRNSFLLSMTHQRFYSMLRLSGRTFGFSGFCVENVDGARLVSQLNFFDVSR